MVNNLPATESQLIDASPSPATSYRAFAIRFGLGFVIVGFLLWRFDARPALHLLARERALYFAAAIAIFLAGQFLCFLRWRLLAAALNLNSTFGVFIRYGFIGLFTNRFVPGIIGGDAARAFYLGRRHGRIGEAIASTVADRAYGLLGLFWFAALIAVTMNHGRLDPKVIRPIIIVGIVGLVGYFASPIIARLIHLTPRPIRRGLGILAPYLHRPTAVLPAIILSMLLQVLLAGCQYVLALGLGLHLPLSIFMLVVPVSGVLASLPLTLNGLGLREAAYLYLFGMAGMGREDAIALGLLFFLATMIAGMFGAIAFVTTEVPKGHVRVESGLTPAV